MKDIKGVFRNLEKLIRGSRWFENDWEIYNSGAYLQLYKKNWHKETQGGIQFETYIGDSQIKKNHSLYLCMLRKIVQIKLFL